MMDQSDGWAADIDRNLFRTFDGGENWVHVELPGTLEYISGLSSFLDLNHVWLADFSSSPSPTLWRTTNGGQTWTHLTDSGLPSSESARFQFTSPDDGLVLVAPRVINIYHPLFETHDGGVTFQELPVIGPTDEFGRSDGIIQYCRVCGNAIYHDSNQTILVEGGSPNPPGAVYVWRSTDLGQRWSKSSMPLPTGYEDARVLGLPLVFSGGGRGYLPVRLLKNDAFGNVYDAVIIYTTTDGGATWDPPTTILYEAEAFMLYFQGLEVKVLCGGDLCVSHDGAQTWETINPNIDFSVVEEVRFILDTTFISPLIGWIIMFESGGGYHLYHTTDGGTTWTLLND
jgi:photosystem II stability/assembly factor-like uncharacterized protein